MKKENQGVADDGSPPSGIQGRGLGMGLVDDNEIFFADLKK